jgi:hypothetical protein
MKNLRTILTPIVCLSFSLVLVAQPQEQSQTPPAASPQTQTPTKDQPAPAGDSQPSGPRDRGERGQRGMGRNGQATGGTITEIKENAITFKTRDGKTATAKLTPDTRLMKNRQPATLKDFKVGDNVMVGGEAAGEGTWNARFVAVVDQNAQNALAAQMQAGMGKEFIAGEVKSIAETKLTILRVDGQTQVIEADENTSFKKQGESVTLADIKPGDHVMGRGELKNGVFVPKTLRIGDFPQMQTFQSAPNK